ncbi:MAG: luciferase family protein [Pseudomonadota bacterium]
MIRQTICLLAFIGMASTAQSMQLPTRDTPRPETTNGVPHIQIGVAPVPQLSAELMRRVADFPGVTLGATRVSLPGATGFQLDENLTLAQPKAIVGGREFAHVHPDGSLHASLHPETARAAVEAGWATPHPWAKQRDGWEGFVMIYTPINDAELEVVFQLVLSSYNFVTGQQ